MLLVVGPRRTLGASRPARRASRSCIAQGGPAAIGLAHEYGPDAVLLDVDAENGVLERLKAEPRTRHLPVLAVGGAGVAPVGAALRRRGVRRAPTEEPRRARSRDLVTFLDRPVRHVLVVEDDDDERNAVAELVGGEGIDVTAVGVERRGARASSRARRFDCIVLDLKLPKAQRASSCSRRSRATSATARRR